MASPSYKFIHKLQGKRVLIFGGTSGIGYAVAEGCIEHGSPRLKSSYPSLPSSQVTTHACDLSNKETLESSIQALLSTITDGGKDKLNHVVFTAGDPRTLTTASNFSVENFEKNQIVRNLAPLAIAKYLPQYLDKSPDSSYTLTGVFIATKPPPGFDLIAASGGFIEGMCRGLAVDMAPVRVNAVAPGVIKTEALKGLPEQALAGLADATTGKRLGRPEDIAEAYLYCMKDGFVTGSIIHSNGGRIRDVPLLFFVL
ncbi:short chain dehydrogenase [Hyaloscypha sp. PMI_1271]|nr:short chain dehydrogenase [Hyaloscypha sp. PMI_1271]